MLGEDDDGEPSGDPGAGDLVSFWHARMLACSHVCMCLADLVPCACNRVPCCQFGLFQAEDGLGTLGPGRRCLKALRARSRARTPACVGGAPILGRAALGRAYNSPWRRATHARRGSKHARVASCCEHACLPGSHDCDDPCAGTCSGNCGCGHSCAKTRGREWGGRGCRTAGWVTSLIPVVAAPAPTRCIMKFDFLSRLEVGWWWWWWWWWRRRHWLWWLWWLSLFIAAFGWPLEPDIANSDQQRLDASRRTKNPLFWLPCPAFAQRSHGARCQRSRSGRHRQDVRLLVGLLGYAPRRPA